MTEIARSGPDDSSAEMAATADEAANEPLMQLHVCVTCRAPGIEEEPRAGRRLHDELQRTCAERGLAGITIVPVECLSVCRRPCTVSFSAPGKWTYVYGDLPADTAAATVLEGATLYQATADGLIPWRQRPDALKKGVVARVPPLIPAPPHGETTR